MKGLIACVAIGAVVVGAGMAMRPDSTPVAGPGAVLNCSLARNAWRPVCLKAVAKPGDAAAADDGPATTGSLGRKTRTAKAVAETPAPDGADHPPVPPARPTRSEMAALPADEAPADPRIDGDAKAAPTPAKAAEAEAAKPVEAKAEAAGTDKAAGSQTVAAAKDDASKAAKAAEAKPKAERPSRVSKRASSRRSASIRRHERRSIARRSEPHYAQYARPTWADRRDMYGGVAYTSPPRYVQRYVQVPSDYSFYYSRGYAPVEQSSDW